MIKLSDLKELANKNKDSKIEVISDTKIIIAKTQVITFLNSIEMKTLIKLINSYIRRLRKRGHSNLKELELLNEDKRLVVEEFKQINIVMFEETLLNKYNFDSTLNKGIQEITLVERELTTQLQIKYKDGQQIRHGLKNVDYLLKTFGISHFKNQKDV